MKVFCVIVILTLPRAFANGGYVISPIMMLGSAIITMISINKLMQAGLLFEIYCYSKITRRIFGRRLQRFVDLLLVITQICFALSYVVFIP